MQKESMIIGNRQCSVFVGAEHPEYLLLQPGDPDETPDTEAAVWEKEKRSFVFCPFPLQSWDDDLTPWEAPPVWGNRAFGSGAQGTLDYVTGELIPALQRKYDPEKKAGILLGGYSLGGFFALWAGYQTDIFSGIDAASPSMWYPGWMEYAASHRPLSSRIYLSLGDREEKTKNKTMQKVGDCIRQQKEILDRQGVPCTLEWNPGNHFKDADLRTAKGFSWLMDQMKGKA